jgi:hypothetical protein
MFFQDSVKNIFLILVIVLVFSGLGYYAAYLMQDSKMTEIMTENNSTINRLSSEVTYLRNMFNDLVIQYEKIEDQMDELQSESTQQNQEYEDLFQKYAQLNTSYQSLLNDYRALNSSNALERETFHNRTRVSENHVRVFFNNVSFEYPQDMVVSLDGPHESIPTNCSRLIMGATHDGKTTVTLSWSHVEDEPDLNATLRDACGSIEDYVNKTGLNNTLIKDDIRMRYINCTLLVGGETRYVLISTWYLSDTSNHYLCVVQQDEDTVVDTFMELMASFYQY